MFTKYIAVISIIIAVLPYSLQSSLSYVPDNYVTIQAAINAVQIGDTILVRNGIYHENINFIGKNIVVIGNENSPGEVIVDGGMRASVVKFTANESRTAVLSGFKLQNGNGADQDRWSRGGGIICDHSSPTLRNLVIIHNQAPLGGGITCDHGSSPLIENVIIKNNNAHYGGGLFCGTSSPILKNVCITDNSASSYGGGVDLHWPCSPIFENVVIAHNEAQYGGGILCFAGSNLNLFNCTVAYNTTGNLRANLGGGIACLRDADPTLINTILWGNEPKQLWIDNYEGPDTVLFAHCVIQDGYDGVSVSDWREFYWYVGNREEDPLFFDAEHNDFRLTEDSPCIDAGTAFLDWRNDTLIFVTPDDYIGEAPDIGAIEFDSFNRVSDSDKSLPADFLLLSNYPNPFNSTTNISFRLTQTGFVTLSVYNQNGQIIKTLYNGNLSSGEHITNFNAGSMPSGLYFIRLDSGTKTSTRPVTVLR